MRRRPGADAPPEVSSRGRAGASAAGRASRDVGGARRFVAAGEASLASLLAARAADDPGALAEGRVFVERRRATGDAELRPGDLVELWPARTPPAGHAVWLLRTPHVIVADKPAGLPTEPDHHGTASLVSEVDAALRGVGRGSDGVHAVSRLDAPVTGAVALALSATGRRELAAALADGRLARTYVAIVGGQLEGSGVFTGPVDGRREATTRWRALASARGASLVELSLETGRKHQIRVHASRAGVALIGDGRYGGAPRVTRADGSVLGVARPMLHAARVTLRDPARSTGIAAFDVRAPVPTDMRAVWAALDGSADVWHAVET